MASRLARKEFKDIERLVPGMYEALAQIGQAINATGIDPHFLELAKIRASQLNGCAQCLGIHLNVARQMGMDPQKIDLIPAWREAGVFDEKEMAVLEWAERITRLSEQHIDDFAFNHISSFFTDQEVAALTGAIAAMNFYNRFGAVYRYSPPRHRPAKAD
jgi:AhpD family alkylhydroperoxidase